MPNSSLSKLFCITDRHNKEINRAPEHNSDTIVMQNHDTWEPLNPMALSLTSLKGLVILVSSCQSMVLHTFRLRSSAWEAMYFPTGSHVSPFTRPVWPFRAVIISGEGKGKNRLEVNCNCTTVFASTSFPNFVVCQLLKKGPQLHKPCKYNVVNEPHCCEPTWKFTCVPDHNGVIHTAGGQHHIMRWPGHIHYICNTHTHINK